MKRATILSTILLFGLLLGSEAFARTFVTIGTGGVTGVYYPTGGAISRMLNKKSKEYGIKATVESTAGSVYNINAVLSGDLEFGVAQSDRQYQASNGLGEWEEKGPQKALRSICSFHSEAITFVATEDSGIRTLADVKGFAAGPRGPGPAAQRGVVRRVSRVAR